MTAIRRLGAPPLSLSCGDPRYALQCLSFCNDSIPRCAERQTYTAAKPEGLGLEG